MEPTSTSGRAPFLWTLSRPAAPLNRLCEDTQAEVCVVGAGIAGLSTAYLLEHDARLWRPVPHRIELGTPDHVIHLVLGLAFIVAAVTTKRVKAPLASGAASR